MTGVDYYRQPTASESDQDMMLDVGDSQQPAGAQAQHLESLKAVEDTLSRMNRLGVTIRQSSGAKAIMRARKFAETLDLGYFTSLCSAAVQFLYPGAQQSLKAYLSHLMTDLYARIQHLESRRRDLETRRARTPRLPTIDEAPADVNSTAGQSFQETPPPVLSHIVQPSFQGSVSQSDLSSVRMSYVLDQLRGPKQASTTSPKTFSIQVNQANYPRPPASEGKSTRCEYCSELLREDDLGGSAWRRHIDRDLKPYACLAEQCPEVDAVFPSFEAWFEHMQMHGRRWHQKNYQTTSWRCVICGDQQMYNNSQDLCSHMEKLHQDTFALSHIPAIARQSRVEHRAANGCLLCCFAIEPEEEEANQGASRPKRPRAPYAGEGAKSSRSSRSMTSPGAKMIEPDPLDSESSSDSDEQQVPEISELSRTVARHIAAHLQVLMLVTLRLSSLQNGQDDDASVEIQSNYAELDENYSVPGSDDSRKPSDIVSLNDGTMERDEEFAGDEEKTTILDYDTTEDRVPSPDIELDFSDVRRSFAPQDDKFLKKMIEHGSFQNHLPPRIPSAHSIHARCFGIKVSGFENTPWLPRNLFHEFLDRNLVEKTIRDEGFEERKIQKLVEYSCQHQRIFLTLAVTELIEKLSLLCSNEITDCDLPVRMETNSDGDFTLRSIEDPQNRKLAGFAKGKSSNGWKLSEVEQFVSKQWTFLAAVFKNDSFIYTFQEDQPLPYLLFDGASKTGHFSKVFKLGLHEDHVEPRDKPYPGLQKLLHKSGQRVFVIAVKRLKRPEDATEEEVTAFFRAERKTLNTMREIAHANLIQAIATYEKGEESKEGGERCFVFPWASGGNLRQLWMHRSPDSQDVFHWAWGQIRGLTEGLDKLHKKDTRHGDLKPENILIFNRGKHPELGSLVIADVGIAKYHAFETSVRKLKEVQTNTRFFTGQYEPPEIRLDQPTIISRKYDSWSLGCVLLEFIIWLQRGKDGLKKFHAERQLATANEDRFWDATVGGGRVLHPTASTWIKNLLGELKGRPELRAWRKLLKLVKSHLLVAVLDQRKYIWDFWPKLQQIHEECSAGSSQIRERSDMVLTKRRESTGRMIDDTDVSISQQKTSKLVDKWETVENTSLAEELLERLFMASSPGTYQLKKNLPNHLCDDCAAIDFGSQTYELHRSMQDLHKMTTRCALCNLLWRRLSGLRKTPQEPLKLIRVGSRVKALPTDETIISLYSEPGRQNDGLVVSSSDTG
ncbi:hypothetical protein SLS63_011262 [Diaporthe eres]|uniref:Protein kinase domain-containing protein n=1 Tax=Diaporthe eres TaxID=83184 RepID=A0ABR1NUL9_DIAER